MNRLSPISLSQKEDAGASIAALRRWVFTMDSRYTPLEASFSFSLEKRTHRQMVALVKMVVGGDNSGMVAMVEMVVVDISLSLTDLRNQIRILSMEKK
ncbi:hypothetical protein F8388_022905 [Cannabis sativa]|uniref:Uncharacterized protein n=1 Tax=Cannabis sativa TaxID=3483 RepID=A0A7J6FH83_CANSA|nr:hypothetical protein F8388_022905 [Cannabis sativa]